MAAKPIANQCSAKPAAKSITRKMEKKISAEPRSDDTTRISPNSSTKWPANCATDHTELRSWYSFK